MIRKKRLLSIALCLCMICAMQPALVRADVINISGTTVRAQMTGATSFNITGLDRNKAYRTTFMNKGYKTAVSVDGGTLQDNAGSLIASGLNLEVQLEKWDDNFIQVIYTLSNTGAKSHNVKLGSHADVMIDRNDRAPICATEAGGNRLSMTGAPKNDYAFKLIADSCNTIWYGFYGKRVENCFTNMTDRGPNNIYKKDSGLAYSWDINISPGGTWTSYVLIGTGNLEQMNVEVPKIPQPKSVISQPSLELSTSDVYFTEDDTLPSDWNKYISSFEGNVTITGAPADSKTPKDYFVVYTASNSEGTASKKLTVHILPKPAELSQVETVLKSGTKIFTLSATMNRTGGLTWTETGFVYGALQNPTLTLKDGSVKTTTAVNTKNGNLTAVTAELTAGITYYARAYAKASDGTVIYGTQSAGFGLGVPKYGVFSVTNNGNNTFTIERTGGTDDAQTVYYRTVNGSAIGGTHFTHAAGSVVFAKSVSKQTVTVTEKGVTMPFQSKPATSYSNANRTYQLEIYRVDGGATINASKKKATRTMTVSSSYHVDANIFNKPDYVTVGPSGETLRGDYDQDKLGWTDGNRIGSEAAAKETVTIPKSGIPKQDYWKNVGTAFGYQVYFQAKEEESGYQHVQLTTGDSIDTAFYPESGKYYDRDTKKTISSIADTKYKAFFAITFEHGGNSKNKNYMQYSLPTALTGNWSGLNALTAKDGYYSSSLQSFLIPFDTEKLTMGFGGSGSGSDKWYTNNITHRFRVIDTEGPKLLGLAPTATGTYRPGDEITIAMVFDEIVDKTNSVAAGLSADSIRYVKFSSRSSSDISNVIFRYAGGADTNVLYFTGTVPENAKGKYALQADVRGLQTNIRDMSNNKAISENVFYETDIFTSSTAKPTVAVNDLTNRAGTITGSITATDAGKLEYAWTNSSTVPVYGWQMLSSKTSTTVTTRQTSGTWYLHARATNSDGQTSTAYKSVTVPASGSGTYAAPELTVSADNSKWARTRNITVTRSPSTATVKVKTPSGTETTITGSSYTANTEGIYTFTLTSYTETVTRQAVVSKLDNAAPVITIHDLPGTSYTERVSLNFSVADSGSGLKSVTAKWNSTTITPVGNADGTYTVTCPNTSGSGKLTVTAADTLGNSATQNSKTYTINLKVPELTVTQTSTNAKGDTYSYMVAANSNTGIVVHLPDGTETTELNGSFTLPEAGTYGIIVTDDVGHFISQTLTVSGNADGTPPEVRLYSDEIPETGNLKVDVEVYEEGSMPTVKRGNTVLTMTSEGEGIYSSSFTLTEGGTYTVTATDETGNSAKDFIIVYALVDGSSKTLKLAADGTYGTLPEPAEKQGYTFDGWYTQEAGGTKVTSGSPETTGYTLYAHWTAIISVDITWSALDFSYSDGSWSPESHAYENGGWSTNTSDGNKIAVENNGVTDVSVTFRYSQKNPAVSGSFADNAGMPITSPAFLSANERKYAWLTLEGKPDENLESAEIGTVTITLGGN